jgi:hypothetical protein
MSARDIRYGRRGGRWAAEHQADDDAIDAWKRQRDALEEATRLAGEQLTFDEILVGHADASVEDR